MKRPFEPTDEDEALEQQQRLHLPSDLSASDSTVAWIDMQQTLAVEAFQTNPYGSVTEEPEIFVGSAGGWTEDGK